MQRRSQLAFFLFLFSFAALAQEAPEAEPLSEEPSAPTREPNFGDEVDGYTLVAFRSEKRLPDGRPTLEPCGYVRDVIVEQGERVEKAILAVPCESTEAGLVPGRARLVLPEKEPLPEERKPKASSDAPSEPASKEEAPASQPADPSPEGVPAKEQADAPAEPKPEEEGKNEEKPDPARPFLKGELTQMGTVQLVNAHTSFGLGMGAAGIDGVYYAVLRPNVNLHFGPFSLGLGAPLRFQLVDTNRFTNALDAGSYTAIFDGAGTFRREDWDQIEDFLRPLRYLRWGRKEDRIFLDINRAHAHTIGHGQLLRRYSPNVDVDEDNLFAEFDAYADFGGVELLAGPFPVPRIAGGLVFVKPLGLFFDDILSKSLSIGFTYLTDLNAPVELARGSDPSDRAVQLAVDDTGQFVYPHKGAVVGERVQGLGLDAEVKVVKWEFIDLKLYGDYSALVLPTGTGESVIDGGATLGALLRMSFGEKPVRPLDEESEEVRLGKAPREMKAAHAMRVRAEGRLFGPRYLPSYFDTLYEADKLQFGFGNVPVDERATLPTKIGWLLEQEGEPYRVGHYLELSYTWVDLIGLTVMYEDAFTLTGFDGVAAARNFALHAETFGLGWLQLFATYHYRHFEDFSKLFTFSTDNEVFYFGGRMALLPILFVNLGAQRSFRTGFSDLDDPKRKEPLPGASPASEKYRYTRRGLENAWAADLEVELGWQF